MLLLKKVFGEFVIRFRAPVSVAMEREELKAAARYWRTRVANARIGEALDPSWETTVRSPFTTAELDRFEKGMLNQLAKALVLVDDSPLFKECGVDISFYVSCVAGEVGLGDKLAYPGFFTRLRILLDKEVAYEKEPFQSGNWVTFWSAQTPPRN